MSAQSSIVEYLDELSGRLTGSGDEVRRFLIEVESHLLDARESLLEKGVGSEEAELAAIDSFGTTIQVAQAQNRAAWHRTLMALVPATASLILGLAAIGMIAIGVAGVLTGISANVGFVNAMYGLPENVVMPMSSCTHWLAVQPTATTCHQAGTLEASRDLTVVCLSIGLLGLLLSIPTRIVWLRRQKVRAILPPFLGPAIGAAIFGAAAVGLSVLGATDAVISTTWGAGMWLTDAAVALAVCAAMVAMLFRAIKRGYVEPFHNSLAAG